MKKLKYLLLMIVMFCNINVVNAAYEETFSKGKEYVNSYIKDFKSYDKYLIFNNNKYGLNESGLYRDSDFIYGGFLNKIEYEVIGGKNSYLYDGSRYYTMTYSGNEVYEVPEGNVSMTNKSGVRVTEYVSPKTKIIGEGTYKNPWEFVRMELVIKYDENKGSSNIIETIEVEEGDKHIIRDYDLTREGYVFSGWKLDKSEGYGSYQKGDTYEVKGDTTFYAAWRKEYKVTYNANGGSGADSNVYIVPWGEKHKFTDIVPTPSDPENYGYAGWSTLSKSEEPEYGPNVEDVVITKDTVFYAIYKPYVAEVVGVGKYFSLSDAIGAITGTSGTINLLIDMPKSEEVTIENGKTITINLNGKTGNGNINNKGTLTISNGNYTNSGSVFTNTGTLTISNGTYTSTNGSAIVNTTGTVNINGGTITGNKYGISNGSGRLNINFGTIKGNTYGVYGTGSNNVYVGRSSDSVSTTNPKVSGGSRGVNMSASSLGFYFYSGVISGTASTPYVGKVSTRTNYKIKTSSGSGMYNSTIYYSPPPPPSSGGCNDMNGYSHCHSHCDRGPSSCSTDYW